MEEERVAESGESGPEGGLDPEPLDPEPETLDPEPLDPAAEMMVAAGRAARLVTKGRRTGRPVPVAVGFVEEPDGSLLVAAGRPDADWALNLLAEPRCRVTIGGEGFEAAAEPLEGAEAGRAIRELILRYGTPAERLGSGPAFRLRPLRRSTASPPEPAGPLS